MTKSEIWLRRPVEGVGPGLRPVAHPLAQMRGTDEAALGNPREVGRAPLPFSVRGPIFHGAEHTARHAGQIATTRKVLRGGGGVG